MSWRLARAPYVWLETGSQRPHTTTSTATSGCPPQWARRPV